MLLSIRCVEYDSTRVGNEVCPLSQVSRLCNHQTDDDRVSKKLGVTDTLHSLPGRVL